MAHPVRRTILILIATLLPAGLLSDARAQDMSEEQRLERCANNRAHIAELQASLTADGVGWAAALGYPQEPAWSDEKIARAQLALRSLDETIDELAQRYDQSVLLQMELVEAMSLVAREFDITCYPMGLQCADIYVVELSQKLVSAGRWRTRGRADALRVAQQIQPFQTNLVALGCDNSGPVAAGAFGSWMTGNFSSDFGAMTLKPTGGTYPNYGTIEVTAIEGATMTGIWQQADGQRCADGRIWGRLRLTFNAAGFTGNWGTCEGGLNGTWNGTRL